jgi:nicotinate-nucleotide adenylyltransferase
VGILGGTFNPPHIGHVALARCALRELRMERVVLMPVGEAPHKPAGEDPGAEHRLRMCRLAVTGAEGLTTCALEVERAGPSYTVDTLRAVHASHENTQLTFIVGADAARTLPSWREPGELLELASLAVAEREGAERQDVLRAVAAARAATAATSMAATTATAGNAHGAPEPGVSFLKMETVEVSSSLVRERVARGEPVEELVGEAVAGYIAEHGLYRDGWGAGGR